ncbi:MAG: hypothetical protein KC621_07135, partial [Myxococcales bacterium]|nr:hypothetical protein [Myxococcales bacterium]
EHYATTEAVTGYRMNRTESWAPSGEGGSRYGQGSTSVRIPAEAEAWYVNMNWSSRPAPGTPMIVRNPSNGRAVVAAAGYETGPSANDAVAGVSEEVHDWLGTSHLSELEIGFAVDPSLPFGPIDCGGSQGGGSGSGGGTSGGSSGGGATTEACYLGSDRSGDTCLALVTLPAGTSGYAYPSSADARYAPPVRYLDLRDWTGSERLAPNFTLSELAIEDDGRWAVVQPRAVAHLQAMRDRLGGLNVNSGYRNVSHNAAVGGATLSRHMWGDAFDLDPSAASLSAMASACRDEGAGYVESYTTHVHCDWRDDALDPVFFGGARSAARMPDDSMVAWLDWRGRALTAPATGFDEGEPLRTWSAWDADGHLLAEVAAETFEPPEGAVTVGVDVGSRLWLELDL